MVQPLESGDPRHVGPYRLIGNLGHGDLGRVFLGRTRGGRLVAVLVVTPKLAADGEFRRILAQEVAEARKVGGFYTAHIVDADPRADPPWLATAYIPGPSLAQAVDAHGPLPHGAVRVLGSGLAEGLAAVHAAGLLHRDLTPGNVILADDGPRVTDFAIARALEAAHPSMTVGGTAGWFLSPEQVRGAEPGPASDVFSLAGVLVYAATGRTPFGGERGSDALHRIISTDPDLDGVPDPLAGLLSACLAKDPADRPTVAEVVDRLTAPSDGADGSQEPGTAWLPPQFAGMVGERQAEQAALGGGRGPGRRALLAAAGAAALAAVAVPVGIGLASRDEAKGQGGGSGGGSNGGQKDVPAAEKLIPLATLDLGKTDTVPRLAYSPDGRLMAISVEGVLGLWDITSRSRVAVLPVPDTIGSGGPVAFSRTGLLAHGYHRPRDISKGESASDIGAVRVWEAASRNEVTAVVSGTEGKSLMGIEAVALSPDGRIVAAGRGGRDCIGKVPLWEVPSGNPIDPLVVGAGKGSGTSAVRSVAFSPDGKILAAGYGDELKGGVALWDVVSRSLIATLPLESTDAFGVTSLEFSPDGRSLAGSFGGIALWDVSSHKLETLADADSGYQSMAFTPDGSLLAGGFGGRAGGGGVSLWGVASRKRIVTVEAGRSGAGDLAFSPDGKTLAAATDNAKLLSVIQLWTVA
ncbi:serine/threonine-protein kinase [Streptomyces sp. NPDC097640]|uniref:WD40 repeat domain-containing serine/threonine protein kinase n=1 Tax=Streptomyces sp. NPDC097640 TaxID=3157229 RepID=UPI00331C4AC7